MKIGITERGDAGINMGWVCKMDSDIDGAVLITKNITPLFVKNVMDCFHRGHKIIVHATCTGWGGTVFEQNVPPYEKQLDALAGLIGEGFPVGNCVLRIDPIMPTPKGLERVRAVISYAEEKGILPGARIRVSIYDEYRHVKERLKRAGYRSLYPGERFSASSEQFRQVADCFSEYGYTFYTCAEPQLLRYGKKGQIKASGCISPQDLQIMGLEVPKEMSVNKQNRPGCLCLSCKTELLTQKRQCPHKCIYCYWRN